jgi:hypothetical protein
MSRIDSYLVHKKYPLSILYYGGCCFESRWDTDYFVVLSVTPRKFRDSISIRERLIPSKSLSLQLLFRYPIIPSYVVWKLKAPLIIHQKKEHYWSQSSVRRISSRHPSYLCQYQYLSTPWSLDWPFPLDLLIKPCNITLTIFKAFRC